MIMPDGNLLIAFKWLDHDHHLLAQAFFGRNPKVVTCPITELNLVRVLMQKGHTPSDAAKSLADFIARHGSKLIPADISATEIAGFNGDIERPLILTSPCWPNDMASKSLL